MTNKSQKSWVNGLDFSAIQYLGERSSQEDYSQFRLFPGDFGLLAVLADGMGGHTSGEIASSAAVNAFDRVFKSYSGGSPISKLAASLTGANAELEKMILKNPRLKGMGCTLVGVYLNNNGMYWVSVGDSLIYLYRNGNLIQINQDHSMAPLIEESYKSGKITKEEADNYPNKNALRSALMGDEISLIDAPDKPMKLYRDDIVVIASDGVLSLSNNEIKTLLKKSLFDSAESISNKLIDAVKLKNRKNQDNTTIQIIKAPGSYSRKPYGKLGITGFLLAILILVGISLGVIYKQSLSVFFESIVGLQNQVHEEVKPVVIPITTSQKNEQLPLRNDQQPSVGGGLDSSKNSKEVPKKSEKKSTGIKDKKNNEKEMEIPKSTIEGKGGLGGESKVNSDDGVEKKAKDPTKEHLEPKSSDKTEAVKT